MALREAKNAGAAISDELYTSAIPLIFLNYLSGRSFRLACLWQGHGECVRLTDILKVEITSQFIFKKCFLARHEVVNIGIAYAQMITGLIEATEPLFLRLPRQYLWWKKPCICRSDSLIDFEQKYTYAICDACYIPYHLQCANLKQAPQGQWTCPICVKALEFEMDKLVTSYGYKEVKTSATAGPLTPTQDLESRRAKKKRKRDQDKEAVDDDEDDYDEVSKFIQKSKKKLLQAEAEPRAPRGQDSDGGCAASVVLSGTITARSRSSLVCVRPIELLYQVSSHNSCCTNNQCALITLASRVVKPSSGYVC